MKILHIGNTAGIATQICKFMRGNGHKCDTMIFYPDTLNQGCDFDYTYIQQAYNGLLRCSHCTGCLKCCTMLRIMT